MENNFFFIKFIGNSTENYIQNTMRQNKKEESRKGQKGVSNGTEVPMLGHSLSKIKQINIKR